jgi:hypothetical protein
VEILSPTALFLSVLYGVFLRIPESRHHMFLPVPLFVYPYSAARRHRDLVIIVRGAANTSAQSIGFDNRSVTRLVSRASNSHILRLIVQICLVYYVQLPPFTLASHETLRFLFRQYTVGLAQSPQVSLHKLSFCQVAVLVFQLAHMSVRFWYVLVLELQAAQRPSSVNFHFSRSATCVANESPDVLIKASIGFHCYHFIRWLY